MKAAQINRYGGPEVIEINPDAPKPAIKDNQVLVEVHTTSINPFDAKLRAGYARDYIQLQFPATLGGDFAGNVKEVGKQANDFKIGDEVFGSASIANGGSGSFAELAAANTINIAQKPKSADFIQAAALPLVGSSTIQALEEHAKLKSKQKILIHGGAGGIGHVAIQLAKALGAYVATTVGGDDINFVKQLGAVEVINYKTQKFEEILKDFDAVYDTVGGETTDRSFIVLKRGGVLVSMLGQPNPDLVRKYGVIGIGQGTKTNTKHLTRLAELVDSGKIKVNVDKVFPLDQAKEAFIHQELAHPRGKVVIQIKD